MNVNALRHFSFNSHKVVASISNQCRRLLTTDPVAERPKTERCINRVTLMGRVGREGETRGTSENPCVIFPLATSFTFRKSATGEYMTRTDWHRVCIFRPGLRQLAGNIRKGDRIHVEGSLSHNKYMDEDNKTKHVTSVIADDIIFVARRNNNEDSRQDEEGQEEGL